MQKQDKALYLSKSNIGAGAQHLLKDCAQDNLRSDAAYLFKELKPGHSIFYNIIFPTSEISDQPMHPRSLIRVFAERSVDSQRSKASSGVSRDSDLSLRWVHVQSCKKLCATAHLSENYVSKQQIYLIT